MRICSKTHIENEIQFLVDTFVENGYTRTHLQKLVTQIRTKFHRNVSDTSETSNGVFTGDPVSNDHETTARTETTGGETRSITHSEGQTVSLPWVPGLSPRLRKIYRKAGYKVVFKSGASLKTILTSKNKTQLPPHSHPGVYLHESTCSKKYIGQTKKRILTRTSEHADNIAKERWAEPIAKHLHECGCQIDWTKSRTLKMSKNRFEREVREALEIQFHQSGPENGGMNDDNGRHLKTLFWTPMLKYLRDSGSYQ